MAALITIDDVMARLNVRRKAVMRLISEGKLTAYKVGPQWRFDPRDVDAFLRSVKFTPSSKPSSTPKRRAPRRSVGQSAGATRYM